MTDNTPTPTTGKILLTGASGKIGTAFYAHALDRYAFRLADRSPDNVRRLAGGRQDHDVIALDIADLAACQQACRGIDTVVHLAADPSPGADFYGSLLDNNIKGTYNIFRAAKDQGCARVVYASSVHAVAGYPPDVQARAESPVRPIKLYGVSKCFGEAVASYFAYAEGLSSIAVRIGAYGVDPRAENPDPRTLGAYVSPRDLNALLVRCVETPDIPFAIVYGLSDNRFKRADLTSTRELLGYEPRDDAFRLFDA